MTIVFRVEEEQLMQGCINALQSLDAVDFAKVAGLIIGAYIEHEAELDYLVYPDPEKYKGALGFTGNFVPEAKNILKEGYNDLSAMG